MSQAFRANYSDLYGSAALPALEELFKHQLSLSPSIREKLFRVVKTERDIWQASEMGDLQNFLEVDEGTDYTYVSPRSGANKTIRPAKYGLGFSISEEAVDDGKFDMIAMMVKMLADSAMDTRESSAMNILNNAFSAQTSWDGVALLHATHTLPSGLTFRNKPATDLDLSPAALDTMLADFETQFIRDSGKKANIRPKYLVVHPNSKRYAREIVGSDLKADSSDNNMNSLKEDNLIVLSSSRLTDSDAWFLVGAPEDTGLVIVDRKGIETKAAGPDAGFDNDSIKYKSRYREKVDVTHPYGIMGSSGG